MIQQILQQQSSKSVIKGKLIQHWHCLNNNSIISLSCMNYTQKIMYIVFSFVYHIYII
ncbi:unnamed protein product [Paramecium sonneborni]|uniref:Uncharacterized protein n=1 Tax=Paramecium sonneborni TaxID=65129 RepID=A0A8S1REV2_9CILI|nr:unnamed protein product [Paramecium sonneborni]